MHVLIHPTQTPPTNSTTNMSTSDEDLILATHVFVKSYMSHFDSSHDYAHVLRVLTLAEKIHAATLALKPFKPPNHTITILLALLHDVADKKYHPNPSSTAEQFLLSAGCDADRATLIQKLVDNVSWSNEQKNPDAVAALCVLFPELAIVQDADRLDAIGAVGIGRAFTYGAVKGGGMGKVIEHFEDKLLKLQGSMKTLEGIKLAKARGERVRLFRDWWGEEVEGVCEPPV